jgi:predicted acylesterase/phospholipase RssA
LDAQANKGFQPKGSVLRFAVAMRGGVSLAVWIGGALREIDRLQRPQHDRLVQSLLDMTAFDRVEIDILTGASAGGLNAALGGFAVARGRPMDLYDVWIQTADIDRLLEPPETGGRKSVLDGKYFREQVIQRMEKLAAPLDPNGGSSGHGVEVFLAATVFGGLRVRDRADPTFFDRRREAAFHFRHLADVDALSDLVRDRAPEVVGTAARATASFPAAFEPVLAVTDTFRGELVLPSTEDDADAVRLLDGGVVDNIPVTRAIRAAAASPAGDPVRRWIVFLHPNPAEPGSSTPTPDSNTVPSIPAVVRDLTSKINSETLLDDLDVLRDYNKEAEQQVVERYSLCQRAFATRNKPARPQRNALGSVDAYCLYELLEEPGSVLPWIPIGESVPASPIALMDEDARYHLRVDLIRSLTERPESLRPFSIVVRIAFLTVELLRWAERKGVKELGNDRLCAYDVLFLAKVLDAILCRTFLDAPGDRIAALMHELDKLERSPSVCALAKKLQSSSSEISPREGAFIWNRLGEDDRKTLEALARGCCPHDDDVNQSPAAAMKVTSLLLQCLVGIATRVLKASPSTGLDPSLFTLMRTHIFSDGSTQEDERVKSRVERLLLLADIASAGFHRGHAVGFPVRLEYARISGAAGSPLATDDDDLDPVPKFERIRMKDGGIDPDMKLAGNQIASFSAFISPRFRANDWMWGRMDAAAGLVDVILRPEYLGVVEDQEQIDSLKTLIIGFFGAEQALPGTIARAAEDVCAELWVKHEPAVRSELCEARHSRNPDSLQLTRTLVATRWQLEILANELPGVLEKPIEPGGTWTARSNWDNGEGASEEPKAQLKRLMAAYEEPPRSVGDLWGRRKTSALGVRVARETAHALVPERGFWATLKRTAVSVPLLVTVAAVLTRGAFLVAFNALVGIVLFPRLSFVTARIGIGVAALAVSAVFWNKFVRRRDGRRTWRGWVAALIAAGFLAAGVLGSFLGWDLLRAPSAYTSAWPWTATPSYVFGPATVVAVGSGIAVICLWIWAKRFWIVLAAVGVGLLLGAWVVLGAWRHPSGASLGQTALAGIGSMWIPVVGLVFLFAAIATHWRPEDRRHISEQLAQEATVPPDDRKVGDVAELRVHGVGGSPGPKLLGYEDKDDKEAPVVYRSRGILVRQRRSDPKIQGFDWGGLNSNSRFQAAWLLLLPFTLVNVSGWADPRGKDGTPSRLTRPIQLLVLMLGWLLTATVAFWVADVLIDYVGYQWTPRALGVSTARPLILRPFGQWVLTVSEFRARSLGVGLGAIVSIALFAAVATLAGNAKRKSREPRYNARTFGRGSGFSDRAFFDRRPSWAGAKLTHLTLAFVVIGVVVVQAFVALRTSPLPARTSVDMALVLTGAAQLLLLVILGVVSGIVPLFLRRSAAGVAWSFCVVAFALTNAFFSGVVMWVAKYLGSHPSRPDQRGLALGRELALVDVFFLVVLVWGFIIGVLVLHRTRIAGVPESCPDEEGNAQDAAKEVRKAQGTARIIHKLDWLLIAFACVFVGLGLGFGVWRAQPFAGESLWRWHLEPPQPGLAFTAAAWMLPAFVVLVLHRIRKAASDNRVRRFIGQAWDVMAFWPRRFHPFAVRSYSHIAVSELRDRIEDLVRHQPVVVSAHSQGSALSVAALGQVSALSQVGLVTYGSHVGTLYRRAFPAYFSPALVDWLGSRLDSNDGPRWDNFYRLTDPIGGPLASSTNCARDHCLADPTMQAGHSVSSEAALEQDRQPQDGLAIHSYYLRERELKDCVAGMKAALAASAKAAEHKQPVMNQVE